MFEIWVAAITVAMVCGVYSPAHLSLHKAAGRSYGVMNNRKAILALLGKMEARSASNKYFVLEQTLKLS